MTSTYREDGDGDGDELATAADTLPDRSDDADDVETDSADSSDEDSDASSIADDRTCAACRVPIDDAPLGLPAYERGPVWLVVDAATSEPCGCRVHHHCHALLASGGPLVPRCLCGRHRLLTFVPADGSAPDDRPEQSDESDDDAGDG